MQKYHLQNNVVEQRFLVGNCHTSVALWDINCVASKLFENKSVFSLKTKENTTHFISKCTYFQNEHFKNAELKT